MPPTVTFITPHQRAASGGVYVIQQVASALSGWTRVRLAVMKGAPVPLAGVEVVPSSPLAELPDADLLVFNADTASGEELFALPPGKGRPVAYFQGYPGAGNPVTEANLRRAHWVIAISRWLVDQAQRLGRPVSYVPHGLDQANFYPGPDQPRRSAVVAMMTHPSPSKGTADGLAALAQVRAAAPEAEVRLFGTVAPDFAAEFEQSPSRARVGELLRESAVFVCPTWAEGFGLTGLEALACGAALATTDTRGNRDYAVDGETALVTPPRRPELLARSTLALLGDPELRARLARTGSAHVRRSYPPWSVAARAFAEALTHAAS